MRTTILLLALGLLAGCSSPTDDQNATPPGTADSAAPATPAAPETPAPAATTATTNSASGIVETVDPTAKTVTIAHGAVAELQWPAMTMTFQAPSVDLSTIEPGDQVSFEFTSSGMDGTITSIESR